MLDLNSIRTLVLARRSELGLRQSDLAQLARVSLPTIQKLEQGRLGELGFSKLSRILGVLGLEVEVRPARGARPTLDELRAEDIDD
jgi:predicted transcriptional regulator